jgi:hypothetical protein
MNKRRCLTCGTPLPGNLRSDAKFCPDKNGKKNQCKNSYNNIANQEKYHLTKVHNKKLLGNRKILLDILGALKSIEIDEVTLQNHRLDLNINSGRGTTENGNPSIHFGDIILEITSNKLIIHQP